MLCHGQGDPRADPFLGGCCYVNGAICPNRWYIEPGPVTSERQVLDHQRNVLGTVDAVARTFVGNNGPRRQRVADAIQGTQFVCKAAILAIDANPQILNNRAQFDTAWAARPEYQPIADAWEAIGEPRNYCQVYGPATGEFQCCFRETEQENAAKAGALTTTAVTIRRSAPGAS